MTAKEIREKYLKFFESKGHKVIPSASLIPENDPTVLFTTAGMHPLVPYLLGEKHPEGSRLCNVQKCVRTNDIDEVGDAWHLTFFEMLGNWSLGDYFKKEAIEWSFEFLTDKKWLGISPERLSVSVFAGDKDASRDEEAAEIWQKVGIPKERIYFYSKSENWWGPAGETGPCGPDTEIFFDTGQEKCGEECEPKCNCGKYAEIWNLVFMEYNKTADGKYVPLKQKNVDTGMGLERTIAVLNGKDNVYETDLFAPIIRKIKELIPGDNKLSTEQIKSIRIIADHIRAATFIAAEGIVPSKLDQGYVLRRLIRRMIIHSKSLGISEETNLIQVLANAVIEIMHPYSSIREDVIIHPRTIKLRFRLPTLQQEEERFEKVLEKGSKKIKEVLEAFEKYYIGPVAYFPENADSLKKAKEEFFKAPRRIPSKIIFDLVTREGIPLEFIKEKARERSIQIDEDGFRELFKKHQEISRKGAEKKFKGGLADASEATIKYHTATHLLQAALREVLGKHVEQRGSNITPERLRFDFSHPEKMTAEQIQKVEGIVNQKIQEKLPVVCEEMSPEEAKKQGAIGLFGHKYGDRVKVYSIGDPSQGSGQVFSREICGGPHTKNTGELGRFQIIKEESSSAGVRRIKASLT